MTRFNHRSRALALRPLAAGRDAACYARHSVCLEDGIIDLLRPPVVLLGVHSGVRLGKLIEHVKSTPARVGIAAELIDLRFGGCARHLNFFDKVVEDRLEVERVGRLRNH